MADDKVSPYVYDITAAPNRQVVMPKTVPLPSLKLYLEDQEAAKLAEEAKWQKALADFETAKAKAEAEEKPAPKPPVRPVPKPDTNDMKFPVPAPATDPDLLHLQEVLGVKVEEIFQQAGELTCQVSREAILEALTLVRDDAALGYEMLADETGTHYPAAKDFAFSVVYHLTSIKRSKRLRLRILIPEGFEPESAVPVYPTANWLEREIWDMLGIRFAHHPDMTRILCPEDWEGHALRKEYPTLGLGQRDIDFREDRSGVLMRIAMEKAGNMGINLNPPRAE
jgi:NADH/F420H2 dehydrogenase subunit C